MKSFLFIIVVLLVIGVNAQEFNKNGTAGFTFLELPATARAAGLGECSVSLSDMNSASVFTNPGGLGFTQQTASFSAAYAPWFADIKNYAASAAYKTDAGVLALHAIMLDYGTMPRTVKLSGQRIYEQTGTFSARSTALGVTYSRQLTQRYSFGVSFKYVNEKIDVYSASNLLFDAGFLYYTGLSSLRLGAAIQNFGTKAKFINSEFKMPAILRIGAAADIYKDEQYEATLLAEALHPTDAPEKLNIGAEIKVLQMLALRGGYKFFSDEESYSLGIGWIYESASPVDVDFSYSDYGRLGRLVRFTIQMRLI